MSKNEDQLYARVAEILESARRQVARTINTAMVHAYWLIGQEIVLVEQGGAARAGYGEHLMSILAERLTTQYGRGFGIATVRRMRSFYLAFPQGSAIPSIRSTALTESPEPKRSTALIESGTPKFPPVLGWSHYLVLLRIPRVEARTFYEIEAARESWSVRELERQISSLLFERLTASKSPDEVLALAHGHEVAVPRDILKDPFVLEFLDLQGRPTAHERDLEQAIIDRLEEFLLEMGKGFCFVGRQKRITIDGDHFYVDLVFYNRLLRCFVLLDLKLGKISSFESWSFPSDDDREIGRGRI
jgi:predicted nuclease of restriction endonuclease-like (RecB) superfamily